MCPPSSAHGPPRLQGRGRRQLKPVLRPLCEESRDQAVPESLHSTRQPGYG